MQKQKIRFSVTVLLAKLNFLQTHSLNISMLVARLVESSNQGCPLCSIHCATAKFCNHLFFCSCQFKRKHCMPCDGFERPWWWWKETSISTFDQDWLFKGFVTCTNSAVKDTKSFQAMRCSRCFWSRTLNLAQNGNFQVQCVCMWHSVSQRHSKHDMWWKIVQNFQNAKHSFELLDEKLVSRGAMIPPSG